MKRKIKAEEFWNVSKEGKETEFRVKDHKKRDHHSRTPWKLSYISTTVYKLYTV
jgi:hypothetical protein